MLKHVFETISVVTGLCAAGLWWLSSKVFIPSRIAPFPPGQATGDPMVEQIGEAFASAQNLSDIGEAMRKASRISCGAAILTAISVGAQAIATGLGW